MRFIKANSFRRTINELQVLFLAEGFDFEAICSELEDLERNPPSLETPSEEWQRYALRTAYLPKKIFDFSRGVLAISVEEWNALAKHLKACKLIVDCKDAATNVSREVWAKIKSELLAPKN